jgi:hypothetical protein
VGEPRGQCADGGQLLRLARRPLQRDAGGDVLHQQHRARRAPPVPEHAALEILHDVLAPGRLVVHGLQRELRGRPVQEALQRRGDRLAAICRHTLEQRATEHLGGGESAAILHGAIPGGDPALGVQGHHALVEVLDDAANVALAILRHAR